MCKYTEAACDLPSASTLGLDEVEAIGGNKRYMTTSSTLCELHRMFGTSPIEAKVHAFAELVPQMKFEASMSQVIASDGNTMYQTRTVPSIRFAFTWFEDASWSIKPVNAQTVQIISKPESKLGPGDCRGY